MDLIADANVLIDYTKADPTVLTMYVNNIGAIYVPDIIVSEVGQPDVLGCESLGLIVVEEPEDILFTAAQLGGALSFEDHVCHLMAVENKWTCATNDKPLHRACDDSGAKHIWGLRIMIRLVKGGQLPADDALSIATEIQKNNPGFINQEILKRFEGEIRS